MEHLLCVWVRLFVSLNDIVRIKWIQDHYLFENFLPMHLYVKNSCEIAYILSSKKYSMPIKKNDSFFYTHLRYACIFDFSSSYWIMDSQAFSINSKAKLNNKRMLQQCSTHSIYLLVYFFSRCFCLPLIFSLLTLRLSLAHHFVLFGIMRNDTVHKKSTKIIS